MEEVESYYDKTASKYDEIFDTLYYRIYDVITWKYLEPYVPSNADALVLDAGGGTGRWAVQMARKGCNVVLMDISKGMLKLAAKRTEKDGLQHKIAVKNGDIAKSGYQDETFDMVLCEHALFLSKEPSTLIKEFSRILKRRGRLVVSIHNRYVQALSSLPDKPTPENLDKALKILSCEEYSFMTKDGKVMIYTWTPEEFRTMLERNGFSIEKMVGKGISMPLRISVELLAKKEYPEELFNKILQFELALCEKPDALALAGHLQAVTFKS